MKTMLALIVVLGTAFAASLQTEPADRNAWIAIQAVSADAARVTGGNVLVRLTLSPAIAADTGESDGRGSQRHERTAVRPCTPHADGRDQRPDDWPQHDHRHHH